MDEKRQVYQWTKRDRALHLLPATPLILFYIGTIYLMGIHSLRLVGVFLLFWIATNFAIMGICNGCPYRGKYCPGVSQLYFAPFLSAVMCKEVKRGSGTRSFKLNLALLGVFGIGGYIYAFYWLFILYWPEHLIAVLALLGLLILHMPLSFFLLCPKCGYNDICPMSKVQKRFKGDSA